MEECLFCQIAKGEIPSEMVFENDRAVAFRDINPKAPVHILIVPRKHIPTLSAAESKDRELLGELLLVANAIALKEGVAEKGYRVVVNNGPEGGQEVYHLHLHVMGGRQLAMMG